MKKVVPRGTAFALRVIMAQLRSVILLVDHILFCMSRTYALRSRRSHEAASWARAGVATATKAAAARKALAGADMSFPLDSGCRDDSLTGTTGLVRGGFQVSCR